MLTVTAGAGSGHATGRHGGPASGHAGPAVSASGARTARSADLVPAATPLTVQSAADIPAVDWAVPDGAKVRFAARSGAAVGLAASSAGRGAVAPVGAAVDQFGAAIDQFGATAGAGAAVVDDDVVPRTGVARAPRGPRAPPLLLI